MDDRPLVLLDAASLYFRAYYGVPETVTAPDGTPVNAVRGFTDLVARVVADRRPARLVACLDLDWRPAFRVAALPSYKAHRVADGPDVTESIGGESVPDTLAPQVPIILEVLQAVGIATGGAVGHEADDVIGTLAAREDRDPVEVVSGDRDLFQCVRADPPVRVVYVGRGYAKAEVLGPAELAARYGLPVDGAGPAYADMAALRGDPSDGLPGVAGVGEKTAATLIRRFGTLEALVGAVDVAGTPIPPAVRSRLREGRAYLRAAPRVVRVALDAPVRLDRDDALPPAPVDPAGLAELRERWGLGGAVERLVAALATVA